MNPKTPKNPKVLNSNVKKPLGPKEIKRVLEPSRNSFGTPLELLWKPGNVGTGLRNLEPLFLHEPYYFGVIGPGLLISFLH